MTFSRRLLEGRLAEYSKEGAALKIASVSTSEAMIMALPASAHSGRTCAQPRLRKRTAYLTLAGGFIESSGCSSHRVGQLVQRFGQFIDQSRVGGFIVEERNLVGEEEYQQ